MFEVVWLDAAMVEMDDIVIAADEPTKIRLLGIVEELLDRLSTAPIDEGESRGGNLRLTFPKFLAVRFSVNEATLQVRITSVQRYGK